MSLRPISANTSPAIPPAFASLMPPVNGLLQPTDSLPPVDTPFPASGPLANTRAFPSPSGPRWEALRDAMGLPEKSQRSAMAERASSFLASIGLPVKLKDLGVESSMLETMANEATRMAMIGNNIRAADQDSCKLVLESAL